MMIDASVLEQVCNKSYFSLSLTFLHYVYNLLLYTKVVSQTENQAVGLYEVGSLIAVYFNFVKYLYLQNPQPEVYVECLPFDAWTL